MSAQTGLLSLGEPLLGRVVACLDICSVVRLGCTCKATHAVALADAVFQLRLMDEYELPLQVYDGVDYGAVR